VAVGTDVTDMSVQQHYVPMPWTLGLLERPLGNARLQTVRLVATLLGSNSPAVNDELVRLGTVSVLLVCDFMLLCSSCINFDELMLGH